MEFLAATGATAAALLAVGAVATALLKWVVVPNLVDFLEAHLEPITKELETNGGTSLKDKIMFIETSVKELNDYQHRRNHDIISQNTAILGWIKFFHRNDIAEMDPDLAARIETALSDRRFHSAGPPDGVERRGH